MKFWSHHFDQPILRKYGLVTVLAALPLVLLLVFAPLPDSVAAIALESMILVGLIWFAITGEHRKVLMSFFGRSIQPFRWWEIATLFFAILVLTYSLDSSIHLLISQFAPTYIEESLALEVIESEKRWWQNGLAVVLAAVVAPTVEEIVFRGMLFSRLAARWNPSKAAIASSILFGLLHMDGFVGSAFFGFCMCIVYYHSRNLWIPIGLHVANNLVAVAGLWFDNEWGSPIAVLQSHWPYYVVGLLTIPIFYLLGKKYYFQGTR